MATKPKNPEMCRYVGVKNEARLAAHNDGYAEQHQERRWEFVTHHRQGISLSADFEIWIDFKNLWYGSIFVRVCKKKIRERIRVPFPFCRGFERRT